MVFNAGFLQHLTDQEAYEEGVLYVDYLMKGESSLERLDSLYYFKGLFQYHTKNVEASILSFSKMTQSTGNSAMDLHAFFLTGFQHAYLKDFGAATHRLKKIEVFNEFDEELKNYELAAVSLLKRDFDSFVSYKDKFTGRFFQLSSFQEQLLKNYEGLKKVRKKSPWVAALLSGVVPGAGKFYTGKFGQGYTTLLIGTILTLQTLEAYNKSGTSSFRFNLFAGLFSTFYVANIWGSVLSVKVYRDENNKRYNDAILLNMHVPLRTIFD